MSLCRSRILIRGGWFRERGGGFDGVREGPEKGAGAAGIEREYECFAFATPEILGAKENS